MGSLLWAMRCGDGGKPMFPTARMKNFNLTWRRGMCEPIVTFRWRMGVGDLWQ